MNEWILNLHHGLNILFGLVHIEERSEIPGCNDAHAIPSQPRMEPADPVLHQYRSSLEQAYHKTQPCIRMGVAWRSPMFRNYRTEF